MTPKFEDGTKVRFNNNVCSMAPHLIGKTFTILAASASWGIGQKNEWHGEYVIASENGEKSVAPESCLVEA